MLIESKNLLTQSRRLGFFKVGNVVFNNKVNAYIYASKTNQDVKWDFNDDIFSSIDWKIPIETPLTELYRQRAQQIRDSYDFVSIYFSGGVDSAAVIRAFIDNNILIDEIVMVRINCADVVRDSTGAHYESEIMLAAYPYLKEVIRDSRTSIRFLDIDDTAIEFSTNSTMLEQYQYLNFCNPGNFLKQGCILFDKTWTDLYEKGKRVAHVMGVDKPVIIYGNGKYTFNFTDHSPHQFQALFPTESSIRKESFEFLEFFFWTPSLPQLVIKQCQIVKALCERNLFAKLISSNPNLNTSMQFEYDPIMRHIYTPETFDVYKNFRSKRSTLTFENGGYEWFYKMPNVVQEAFHRAHLATKVNVDKRFFSGTALKNPISKTYEL